MQHSFIKEKHCIHRNIWFLLSVANIYKMLHQSFICAGLHQHHIVYMAVWFISLCLMFTNQSPCGPCGCAAADRAAGASNGLKSLWGCCKQVIPQSVCAAVQRNNLIKGQIKHQEPIEPTTLYCLFFRVYTGTKILYICIPYRKLNE